MHLRWYKDLGTRTHIYENNGTLANMKRANKQAKTINCNALYCIVYINAYKAKGQRTIEENLCIYNINSYKQISRYSHLGMKWQTCQLRVNNKVCMYIVWLLIFNTQKSMLTVIVLTLIWWQSVSTANVRRPARASS